ncbi:MAG: N-acetyltransferase [Treponemataceae bacterium]|nr:MAG: N-acetyltransferase [Treponemataceae bacterium]
MNPPVVITEDNGKAYFVLKRLVAGAPIGVFECRIGEYADYLQEDALRAQSDHVAQTWLLQERESSGIVGYMSLIADAAKLSTTEKELHKLDYPFKTIPAMKIGKLAVAEVFRQKYCGVGTYLIYHAGRFARISINPYCVVRFLTVDADIEHDEGVLAFYQNNGFVPNAELSGKHRKTISMSLDLYI